MPLDILEATRQLLPDSLVTKTALTLGESEINTRRAFKGAVPAILGGLLHQSSRRDGLGIMDLLKNVRSSGAINALFTQLENSKSSGSTTADPVGAISPMIPGWLKSVFDGKLINIVNAISVYADIKSSSANSILKLAAPVALTPVAQYAEENNMGAADIDNFLQSQKASIVAAVPSGFNLTGSLGLNTLEDIGTKITTITPKPSEYQRKSEVKSTAGKWIWPLLLLLTFGGLVWFFAGRNTEPDTATVDSTISVPAAIVPVDSLRFEEIRGKMDSITGNFIYDLGAEIDLKLPDSTLLKVGTNSTEARLFKMLTDTTWLIDSADKTRNWVSFDRLFFEKGKAILSVDSKTQVKNIADILKNYPKSIIKIGGYTDNSGDSVLNKKISGERARRVMQELIKFGAAPQQIQEAEGYGSEHPVCPANDTPDCMARNRRVDLKLASKD